MTENDFGVQPLDGVMVSLGLSNADIVEASTEQLTFKMVQKGRKGRRLSPNVQKKILQALKNVRSGEDFEHTDLFSY